MTTTADLRQLTETAAELLAYAADELAAAQDDVALLERLTSAQERVKRLTGEHRKALAVHEAALAAEAKAAEAARFNGLQAIDVIDEKPGMGLTGAPFRINYTRLAYDIDARDNLPDHASIMGFEGLPDNVFDFLIERHPQKIPDRIASLAPGNPREAFRRYFMGRRNGYVS